MNVNYENYIMIRNEEAGGGVDSSAILLNNCLIYDFNVWNPNSPPELQICTLKIELTKKFKQYNRINRIYYDSYKFTIFIDQ